MVRKSNYRKIYDVVLQIPRGRVATYGQVARLAGLGGHARQVGYALHNLPEKSGIPWQRVINSKGEISQRPGAQRQKELLLEEGVVFSEKGRVDLKKYGWSGSSQDDEVHQERLF